MSSVLLPRFYSPRISPYLMIIAVTGSTILQTYFSGALTIALPTIGDQLGFGGQDLQWPLTMYSLLNGAFLLLSGALADAYGRRLFFFIGILWLMIFSLATTFVKTSTEFIALCAALGLGCAILSPASTGLLSFLPEGNLRNFSYACLGGGQPTGFLLGLFSGGFLSQRWHIVLYIMTGCSGAFALLALISLPANAPDSTSQDDASSPSPSSTRRFLTFDWFGAFLSTVGLILLTFALADAGSNTKGWNSPVVPAMLPLAALALLSFGLWEYRAERRLSARKSALVPLLPPSIWKVPTFTPLLCMVFFAWANFNTVTFYGTVFMQEVQKLSPIQAAIRFIPMVVSGIVYNIFTGLTMARVHGLWLIVIGCIGAAVSCIFYAIMTPTTLYWSSLFITFILTTATDILFPVAQLHACNCVGPQRAALAGGLFNTTVRLASSLGLAITATISSSVTKEYVKKHAGQTALSPEALLKGYEAAVWFCFAMAIVALLIAVVWLRGIGIVGFRKNKLDTKQQHSQQQQEEHQSVDSHRLTPSQSSHSRAPGDVKAPTAAAATAPLPGSSAVALALATNQVAASSSRPADDSESMRGLRSAAATPGTSTPLGNLNAVAVSPQDDAFELKLMGKSGAST